MRISRKLASVVGVVLVTAWSPSVLRAAEGEPPASREPQVEEPATGATGPAGLERADPVRPAEASAAGEDEAAEPKERAGVVKRLRVKLRVPEGEAETTKEREVDWKLDEPGTEPALAAITVTEIEIETDSGAVVTGTPVEAVERLVRAGRLAPGHRVAFTGGDGEAVSVRRKIPGAGRRVLGLAGGLGLLLVFAWAALRGWGNVKKLVMGEDNRYSSSKFQIALWFAVLIALYLSAVGLRWWASFGALFAGVGIPTNLLLLSGLSVLSFAGAKGIKQGQVAKARTRHVEAMREAATMEAQASQVTLSAQGGNVETARRAAVLARAQQQVDQTEKLVAKMTTPGKPSFPYDLVQDDDGNPDLGSFQMLVVTLLAVGTYLWLALAWQGGAELVQATGVTLPDVDTTILAAFGLGQGAYLTKKFAENPS